MERRKWPAEKRLEILREGIRTGQISEVCRRQGCSTAQYYKWQRQLLSSAPLIFEKKAGRPSRRGGEVPAGRIGVIPRRGEGKEPSREVCGIRIRCCRKRWRRWCRGRWSGRSC